MLPSYDITITTPADAQALEQLSILESRPAPEGRALIARAKGEPVAALGLDDGRVVADPFQATAQAVAALWDRARDYGLHPKAPSLRERLRAGLRGPRPAFA